MVQLYESRHYNVNMTSGKTSCSLQFDGRKHLHSPGISTSVRMDEQVTHVFASLCCLFDFHTFVFNFQYIFIVLRFDFEE